MRRTALALSLAALAAVLLLAPSAHADCPVSTYYWGGLDPANPIVMFAAANDTTFRHQACETIHGRYQVSAGRLLAATYGCSVYSSFPDVTGLETVIEDDFTVTGLAAGTPVTFDALLDFHGVAFSQGEPGSGGGGRVRALILESAMNQVSVQQSTSGSSNVDLTQTLVLHVNALAGTPVRLRFSVRGECLDGQAVADGTFRFAALPPGAAVHSCRGYSSMPVAAHRASWGQLKVHAR